MSEEKLQLLREDPEGLPDFTLPVAITAQLITSLAVDIAAQSIGNLKVDISAQSIEQLNVNIASSTTTLNVNVTNAVLSVSIQSSAVTIDVNITNAQVNVNVVNTQLNVNITNAVLNVHVTNMELSVYVTNAQLDVNVTNAELNVNVTNAELNVNVTNTVLTVAVTGTVDVNITAQTAVLNINIQDFAPTITHTALLEKGVQVIKHGYVYQGSLLLYTVPEGKTAFLMTVSIQGWNVSETTMSGLLAWVEHNGEYFYLANTQIAPQGEAHLVYTGGIMKLYPGDKVELEALQYVGAQMSIVVIEV